jgi:hypothetical protein
MATMTLAQLAAHLDQLKRPIEEAPKDGAVLIGFDVNGMFGMVWWSEDGCRWVHWLSDGLTAHPTHFLPLPVDGPLEFEVVPAGTVRKVHIKGLVSCDGRIETEEDPRPCVRGLETGAEVGRLEGEE